MQTDISNPVRQISISGIHTRKNRHCPRRTNGDPHSANDSHARSSWYRRLILGQLEPASGRLTAYGRTFRINVAKWRGVAGDLLPTSFPMSNCADAALLTPDERLREAASILAAGVLRLHKRSALPDDSQENPARLSAAGLEVSDETVLSVHTG